MQFEEISKTLAAEVQLPEAATNRVVEVVADKVIEAARSGEGQVDFQQGAYVVSIDRQDLLDTLIAEAQIPAIKATQVLNALVELVVLA